VVLAGWVTSVAVVRYYNGEAGEMAERLAGTVLREGLREYYDPYTGQGLGALDFGWTSLVLELGEPGSDAARSYL
jgi:hypothetical protein